MGAFEKEGEFTVKFGLIGAEGAGFVEAEEASSVTNDGDKDKKSEKLKVGEKLFEGIVRDTVIGEGGVIEVEERVLVFDAELGRKRLDDEESDVASAASDASLRPRRNENVGRIGGKVEVRRVEVVVANGERFGEVLAVDEGELSLKGFSN